MNTIIYKIDFFSYWHVSSGLNATTYADLLVMKAENGLPFLPGKTLKGLLRESAETINKFQSSLIEEAFINDIFGERSDDSGKHTKEALSFFSNGTLSKQLQTQIPEEDKSLLYHVLSSTRIEKNGQAKDNSLRQLEVTIPLTLYATIEHFPNKKNYLEQLEYCMNFTKRMGLNRTRGLGRCQFSILKK